MTEKKFKSILDDQFDRLLGLLSSPNHNIRLHVIHSLSDVDRLNVDKILSSLVSDSVYDVRFNAFEALFARERIEHSTLRMEALWRFYVMEAKDRQPMYNKMSFCWQLEPEALAWVLNNYFPKERSFLDELSQEVIVVRDFLVNSCHVFQQAREHILPLVLGIADPIGVFDDTSGAYALGALRAFDDQLIVNTLQINLKKRIESTGTSIPSNAYLCGLADLMLSQSHNAALVLLEYVHNHEEIKDPTKRFFADRIRAWNAIYP